jgi:hypothetical protein
LLQRYLHQLKTCARSFGAVLELRNLDLSILQEAVTVGTTANELHILVPDAVAHTCELMTDTQKEWQGFDRWYRAMIDFVVFVTEENPIDVEE